MSFGKQLKELIGTRKQEAVACEWLEGWKAAAGGKEYSTEHVVSSLSRCVSEQPAGIPCHPHTTVRVSLQWQANPVN